MRTESGDHQPKRICFTKNFTPFQPVSPGSSDGEKRNDHDEYHSGDHRKKGDEQNEIRNREQDGDPCDPENVWILFHGALQKPSGQK
jgi:hypothetical protein